MLQNKHLQRGISLVEVLLASFVFSVCFVVLAKFMNQTSRSITESLAYLQTQASAEDLFQQIRWMKWDTGSIPGQRMDLMVPPLPRVSPFGPPPNPPQAIEDWNGYTDVDTSRGPYGPINRSVRVEFMDLVGGSLVPLSSGVSDRKRVVVTAQGRVSTATISGVFYNLP